MTQAVRYRLRPGQPATKTKKWGRLNRLISKRNATIFGGASVAIFVTANAIVLLAYSNRTYPKTSVGGQPIGNVAYASFPAQLAKASLLPQNIKLGYNGTNTTVKTAVLGASVDKSKAEGSARRSRSWLPLANLFIARNVPLSVSLDSQAFDEKAKAIIAQYQKQPVDARIMLKDGLFAVQPEVLGQNLTLTDLKKATLQSLSAGKSTVELPITTTTPKITSASLSKTLENLKKQQSAGITLNYQNKDKQISPAEIGNWFELKGSTYELNDLKIRASITAVGAEFGIRLKDASKVTANIKDAVQQGKTLGITLDTTPFTKTYTYCTTAKGIDANNLPTLQTMLRDTYADYRGWSLDGQIGFSLVTTGCNFTVWLTAADEMPSFGAICDSQWSCRVGDNVVINFDRWQNASPAWNQSAGSLDNYRYMVINHETGHWFGFNHVNCPGAGQPAPVMQQQSINLQGCTFNPWPLPSEQTALKTQLGI